MAGVKIKYFPHFLKESTTVSTLEMMFENDGYAVWFKLLELLGKSKDYRYEVKTQEQRDYLLKKCRVNKKTMAKILKVLCELKAIDKETYVKEHTLYVPNLKRSINNYIIKKRPKPKLKNPKDMPDEKDGKKKYLDYLYFFDGERAKLHSEYGEKESEEMLRNMNIYIGEDPVRRVNKYKSHYFTCRKWFRMKAERDKKNQPTKKPQYKKQISDKEMYE